MCPGGPELGGAKLWVSPGDLAVQRKVSELRGAVRTRGRIEKKAGDRQPDIQGGAYSVDFTARKISDEGPIGMEAKGGQTKLTQLKRTTWLRRGTGGCRLESPSIGGDRIFRTLKVCGSGENERAHSTKQYVLK